MRITAGVHRSRQLVAPKGTATRPTSDRVREALFSILGARGVIAGQKVLDLYAGTGALGLEALSRGADRATFVESDREALACLRKNVETLGETSRAVVVASRAERAISRVVGPFDLVLCDPPYAHVADAAKTLAAIASGSTLAAGAIVVLEHASRDAPPTIEGLSLVERRTYGDTALAIYELSPGLNPV